MFNNIYVYSKQPWFQCGAEKVTLLQKTKTKFPRFLSKCSGSGLKMLQFIVHPDE